jgi:hypothetical protein
MDHRRNSTENMQQFECVTQKPNVLLLGYEQAIHFRHAEQKKKQVNHSFNIISIVAHCMAAFVRSLAFLFAKESSGLRYY